jgi:hypothetical protein
MKRINVSPDLLASMTADALFGGRSNQRPAEPAGPKRVKTSRLGRWFKPRPANPAASKPSSARGLTLDDDWVGGWYARTRQLQAATLANFAERSAARTDSVASDVDGGESKAAVDVVTQIKDFS